MRKWSKLKRVKVKVGPLLLLQIIWTDKRQKAFDEIKKRMTITLIVAYLIFENPFILYMNASGKDIGAVLYQKDDQDKEYTIACISRALNQHEKNYLIIERNA